MLIWMTFVWILSLLSCTLKYSWLPALILNFLTRNVLVFQNLAFCKRSSANVIFSQACVKNSVHRGGGADTHLDRLGRCPPGRHPLGRHPNLGRHLPGQTPPWANTLPQADTLTPRRWLLQQAVHILLECIFVLSMDSRCNESRFW